MIPRKAWSIRLGSFGSPRIRSLNIRWSSTTPTVEGTSSPAPAKPAGSDGSAPSRDPVQLYDHMVETGAIKNDPYQRGVLQSMEQMYLNLKMYQPPDISANSSGNGGFFSKLFGKKSTGPLAPKGIYLYGDVGCGKTTLMDMFYRTIPSHLTKRRIHFHQFIQDVHKRNFHLHQLHGQDFDAAPKIADEIASEANVLCFDEFQVIDVADAMILRRLFDILMSPSHGTVLFATSNRAPDQLYENGIQRQSFIPAIELLKARNEVVYLKSPTDYRKIERESQGTYFFPPENKSLDDVREAATNHIDNWFKLFAATGDVEWDRDLHIWGRPVRIPKSVKGRVAQFTFDELCNKPLSAADYLEITSNFPAIVLSDIPLMSVRQIDVTRRFITFLDAAYEGHALLAVTAEKPFEHLFTDSVPGLREELNRDVDSDADFLLDSNMFSGDEEKFAFARALSRLKQMSSKEWHDTSPLNFD